MDPELHLQPRALTACPQDRDCERQRGIALVVVFILFVVLYLVVFQLEYSTKMGEELAEVRQTESGFAYSIQGIAAEIMVLLSEDLKSDESSATGTAMPGASGDGPGAGEGGGMSQVPGDLQAKLQSFPGLTEAQKQALLNDPSAVNKLPEELKAGMGDLASMALGNTMSTGNVGSGTIDYAMESLFLPDTKTINDLEVKIVIRDNERTFDLNRLWQYVRVRTETLTEEQAQEEFAAATEMVESIAQQGAAAEAGVTDETELNTSPDAWIPPTEEVRELVREMLGRTLDMMVSLNLENGFEYQFDFEPPMSLAAAIEEYCYQVRSMPSQNRLTMLTDLMNLDGVTPELFYGPIPHIPPGDQFLDPYGEFAYRKDPFGDLVGEYQYISPDWLMDQEARQADLEMLLAENQFASFQQFPGLGLLGNPLTRNKQEIPERTDEDGIPIGLAVPPYPIGLRDLFSTISTGKININTASIPVLYGLLLSLTEDEAAKVASDIHLYRQSYQELMPEEGSEAETTTPDLGQPRREPPPERDEFYDDYYSQFPGMNMDDTYGLGAAGLLGMSSEDLMGISSYEDYPTNYFTNLRQLVLIDGEEGGSDDFLTEQGVERIDEDYQSPLQLVTFDLENAAVFGSSYFTATIRAKTEKSPIVRVGSLVIHRDVANRRMEVLQWKEYAR